MVTPIHMHIILKRKFHLCLEIVAGCIRCTVQMNHFLSLPLLTRVNGLYSLQFHL